MATAVDELCFQPISSLAAEIESRRVSPIEVTEAYLRRIERLDRRIHAYITVTADRARAEAQAAEAEISHGA